MIDAPLLQKCPNQFALFVLQLQAPLTKTSPLTRLSKDGVLKFKEASVRNVFQVRQNINFSAVLWIRIHFLRIRIHRKKHKKYYLMNSSKTNKKDSCRVKTMELVQFTLKFKIKKLQLLPISQQFLLLFNFSLLDPDPQPYFSEKSVLLYM